MKNSYRAETCWVQSLGNRQLEEGESRSNVRKEVINWWAAAAPCDSTPATTKLLTSFVAPRNSKQPSPWSHRDVDTAQRPFRRLSLPLLSHQLFGADELPCNIRIPFDTAQIYRPVKCASTVCSQFHSHRRMTEIFGQQKKVFLLIIYLFEQLTLILIHNVKIRSLVSCSSW